MVPQMFYWEFVGWNWDGNKLRKNSMKKKKRHHVVKKFSFNQSATNNFMTRSFFTILTKQKELGNNLNYLSLRFIVRLIQKPKSHSMQRITAQGYCMDVRGEKCILWGYVR